MDLLDRYLLFIKKESLFEQGDKLLLAVSGGVDSVVLCELCHRAGFEFAIAHCNFKLRQADSDADEQFVKDLAKKYGAELFVRSFDTLALAAERKRSVEEMARDLRYSWFHELLVPDSSPGPQPVPYRCILTAHHADDNIETLLMNFFRGTGIRGLHGIMPKQGKVVRPLLFAWKEELVSFAMQQGLRFVTDHTNAEEVYTRNYFRNRVIPLVAGHYPEVKENLVKNIGRFGDVEVLYNQAINMHKAGLLEKRGNEVHIPVLKLKKSIPLQTIVYEIIKDYGFTSNQVDEVLSLLDSESGHYIRSHSHRIIKNRKWLIIAPGPPDAELLVLIEKVPEIVRFSAGTLALKKLSIAGYPLSIDPNLAHLDAAKIHFPLLLRKWKTGDYFYPLGMRKKKKLSRFLIDNKCSLTQKEKTWVIESQKKILWVVGMRIDDRFKVTPSTKEVLSIAIEGKDLAG